MIIIHTYPSRQLSDYTLHWQFVVPSPRPGLSICRNRSLAVRSLCRYSMFLMSCLCTNLCAYSKELNRKNLCTYYKCNRGQKLVTSHLLSPMIIFGEVDIRRQDTRTTSLTCRSHINGKERETLGEDIPIFVGSATRYALDQNQGRSWGLAGLVQRILIIFPRFFDKKRQLKHGGKK